MNEDLKQVSTLFGSDKEAILFSGGQGKTYKSGNIVIKKIIDEVEGNEMAEIMNGITISEKIRLPKPFKSINGNWIEEGYMAWTYLEGLEAEGKYKEKIEVCDSFNEIFKNVSKPSFIETANHSWAIADKVVWDEVEMKYEKDFQDIIDTVRAYIKPINLPNQIIHGDIAGNMIFNKENVPGVIDITLYWRPADYVKALFIVHVITWEDADIGVYNLVKNAPEMEQLVLRATLVKIIEQPEHVKYFSKNRDVALGIANKHLETLRKLSFIK